VRTAAKANKITLLAINTPSIAGTQVVVFKWFTVRRKSPPKLCWYCGGGGVEAAARLIALSRHAVPAGEAQVSNCLDHEGFAEK
jgi:hypothetical protein